NFIKTGDPNTDGVKTTLLKWPKYDNEKHYVFKVDTFSTVEKYELLERLDALEQIIFDRKLKESESKTQEELEKSFHEE
ncbi:MAG: carboxylesterase family protein, partial [Aeromonadales bacterium]|nr:carboxylesterase family protein [Aeromonadales bacterium]